LGIENSLPFMAKPCGLAVCLLCTVMDKLKIDFLKK